MLNSCLEKYSIVYQFQNLVLKNTRSNKILLPRMGLAAAQPCNCGGGEEESQRHKIRHHIEVSPEAHCAKQQLDCD